MMNQIITLNMVGFAEMVGQRQKMFPKWWFTIVGSVHITWNKSNTSTISFTTKKDPTISEEIKLGWIR